MSPCCLAIKQCDEGVTETLQKTESLTLCVYGRESHEPGLKEKKDSKAAYKCVVWMRFHLLWSFIVVKL